MALLIKEQLSLQRLLCSVAEIVTVTGLRGKSVTVIVTATGVTGKGGIETVTKEIGRDAR